MILDPTQLRDVFLIVAAWSGAFLTALWLSLVIWTYRDIRARARDPLARILAALVVAVLFLPGIVIYLILRPRRTLEEEYQQTLEEEALLQSIEEPTICPGCGRHTQADWLLCPSCHTRLKKACEHCGKLIELPWNICPYCGTSAADIHRDDIDLDEALQSLELNIDEQLVRGGFEVELDQSDPAHETLSESDAGKNEEPTV